MRALVAVAILGTSPIAPSAALAGPVTAGVTLGIAQDKINAEQDSSDSIGLFGRLAFGRRIAGQLEIQKLNLPDDTGSMRTVTGLLVVDLRDATRGPLVPIFIAGIGVDHQWVDDYGYPYEISGKHIEGGLGLEYRARTGLTVGIDLRIGNREIENQTYYDAPVADAGDGKMSPSSLAPCEFEEDCSGDTPPAYYGTGKMGAGEYRAARLYVGIHF